MCQTSNQDKKKVYSNLDVKSIADRKTSRRTLEPLCSKKTLQPRKTTFVKVNKMFDHDKEFSNIFNNFFANVVNN